MPCLRHSSATGTPASCSFRMPMICSSVYRDRFIRPSPSGPDSISSWLSFRGARHSDRGRRSRRKPEEPGGELADGGASVRRKAGASSGAEEYRSRWRGLQSRGKCCRIKAVFGKLPTLNRIDINGLRWIWQTKSWLDDRCAPLMVPDAYVDIGHVSLFSGFGLG